MTNNNLLPSIQIVDEKWVEWIKNNNPFFGNFSLDTIFKKEEISFLKRFKPHKSWFVNESISESVHGRRHCFRCVIYSFLLAKKFNFNKEETINLLISSAVHDIGRLNDNETTGHGERGALFFDKIKDNIIRDMQLNEDDFNLRLVKLMIRLHDKEYSKFSDEEKILYFKNKLSIDLIKVSDALDRYRLPKINWWIDDKYLSIKINEWIKQFAYNLVLKSEYDYLKNKDVEVILSLLN